MSSRRFRGFAGVMVLALAACGSPGPKTTGPIAPITVESTSAAEQRDVPFTFGQVFAAGDLAPGTTVSAKSDDGLVVPLQVDVKATHPDGSVRHAVLSGVLPVLGANESRTLTLTRGLDAPGGTPPTPQALLASGFGASVTIVLGGQTYQASADELLKADAPRAWLAGPVAGEWLVSAPLKTPSGEAHPHLTARFAIRAYSGTPRARVDVTLENDWAYEPAPQKFTYDVAVVVGGNTVFSQSALTHFRQARWRKTFWWGAEPQLHLRHDSRYLIASKAVPNYDPSVTVSASTITALGTQWANAKKGPMASGHRDAHDAHHRRPPRHRPAAAVERGLRDQHGPSSKATVLGTGDLAGSWPIHYRNKTTDLPVTPDGLPVHDACSGTPGDTVNPATKKSEAFPACGGTCNTAPYNYQPDSAHQPSLAYLPYLVTRRRVLPGGAAVLGELERAAVQPLLPRVREGAGDPGPGARPGLVAADARPGRLHHAGRHPLKGYFSGLVANNVAWYTATYVSGNPNALGVIDGSGK